MSEFIDSNKIAADNITSHFEQEIGKLKIGRATPSLVENCQVDAYGVKTPLQHLATISVVDAKTLVIQPWDKGQLKEVEKAVATADVGATAVDDNVVRVTLASLTEETRKEIVKKLHQKAEEAKVTVKNLRESIKGKIVEQEKNKEISEDEKYKLLEELDEFIKKINEKIKKKTSAKEEEIMKI